MTHDRPFASTPEGLLPRTLSRAGCDLHYWTAGPASQPLVVFMHGATMDHRMFNSQLPALLPEHRVLVWDARGHGRSQPMGGTTSVETCAMDMLAILDRESVDAAVFCGQSFGGYIAQRLYLTAPTRVRGLAIIGATPIAQAYRRLDIWALKASLQLFRLWPYRHFTRTLARATAADPDVQSYALHASRQIGRTEFLKIWRAVTEAIDTVGIPALQFDVPLLLMHGDTDRTGTIRRDMPRWAASVPTARYCIVPHAGHNANQDNPEFVNRELVRFLKTLPG